MNKRIICVVILILVLLIGAYSLQNYLTPETLPYSLENLYLFHGIAVLIVYLSVELINKQMPNQLGYAYLTLIFFKMGLFILIFKSTIFSDIDLTLAERLGLLVPFFLFLIVETVCIAKLLKSN